jgi:hypothetical protein
MKAFFIFRALMIHGLRYVFVVGYLISIMRLVCTSLPLVRR